MFDTSSASYPPSSFTTFTNSFGIGTATPGSDLATLPTPPSPTTPILEVNGDIALTQGAGGQVFFSDGTIICGAFSTCSAQQKGGTYDNGEVTQATYIVVSDDGTEIYGYVDSYPDSYMVGENAVIATLTDAQMSVDGTPSGREFAVWYRPGSHDACE